MTRKGQAALEYMVTYGWAILAILVAVGALAYFGLLSPSRYLPTSCEFGAQLECVDFLLQEASLSDNGCILLQLRNNFADGIRINSITTLDRNTRMDHDKDLVTCDGSVIAEPYINITKGNTSLVFAITLETDNALRLVDGDRNPIQLIVNYSRNLDGSVNHTLTGEIFASVTSKS